MKKIILVTGANRGIGKEICRQLALMGHQVIMGSRNLDKGIEASGEMKGNIKVQQCDVTSDESIAGLFEIVKSTYGRLDVLINNAGLGAAEFQKRDSGLARVKDLVESGIPGIRKLTRVMTPVLRNTGIISKKENPANVPIENVKQIMETNFYGPWRMIQTFLPLLEKSNDGRIINMSSGMGELNSLKGDYPAYRISKSSLNALTMMFANELKSRGINVNAMCPGWVKTDMGGPDAPRTVEQGADTAVWLATADQIPTGQFFRDRSRIDW